MVKGMPEARRISSPIFLNLSTPKAFRMMKGKLPYLSTPTELTRTKRLRVFWAFWAASIRFLVPT
eukprot:scaffold91626_cov36-Prasinocladus_malaysianus.AAC.1